MASITESTQRKIDIPSKILQYEEFLNERLKADLKKALEQRDTVTRETSEYIQLRNVIERIQLANSGEPLKTMVDLGANFYCKAKVQDPSKIFVAVGYGFFVEFTLDEAMGFIDKKVALLSDKVEKLTRKISEISARIKIVVEGLRELHFGDTSEDKPAHNYTVF
jgi:prefoldin alpha subunit